MVTYGNESLTLFDINTKMYVKPHQTYTSPNVETKRLIVTSQAVFTMTNSIHNINTAITKGSIPIFDGHGSSNTTSITIDSRSKNPNN